MQRVVKENVKADKEAIGTCWWVIIGQRDSEREGIFILMWPCLCFCTAS